MIFNKPNCKRKHETSIIRTQILTRGVAHFSALGLLIFALSGCGMGSSESNDSHTSSNHSETGVVESTRQTDIASTSSTNRNATTEPTTLSEPDSSIINHWPPEQSPEVATVWQPDLSAYLGRSFDACPLSGITVIIDAGHGGTDPGAVKSGINEKDLNLSVSLLLQDALINLGASVAMTRADDSFVSLHRRSALTGQLILMQHEQVLNDTGQDSSIIPPLLAAMEDIISANTDMASSYGRGIMYGYGACADLRNLFDIERQYTDTLFLSIHSNSNPNASLKGTTVYYSTSQDIYDGERESINSELPRNPAYWYYRDNERQHLADDLYSTIASDIPELCFSDSNPVRQGHYAVLREENLTSAILEMAYMSNSSDLAFISKPENQFRIAQAIARAIYIFYCAD
jgi:N-acetylmuramoyl-L-alanine amidase